MRAVGRRRDRAPLTRDEIVRAALRVSEAVGVDQLSVHKVGAELGVTGMSIYNHVADKAELLDLMADTILNQIDQPALEGLDWDEVMRRLAWAFRTGLLRYPRTAPLVLTRRLNAPSALPLVDVGLGAIRAAGYNSAEAVRVLRLFIAFLLGTMMREIGMGPDDAGFATSTPSSDGVEALANVTECAGDLAVIDHEDEFTFGLETLIGSVRQNTH